MKKTIMLMAVAIAGIAAADVDVDALITWWVHM